MSPTEQTHISLSLLVPSDNTTNVADLLRILTDTEPVVISKPGMKIDKVAVYLSPDTDVVRITDRLQEAFATTFKAKATLIKKSDWMDAWKEHYHAFKLTPRITVTPSWKTSKKRLRKRDIEIMLDPGYAFGTGLHATTQFMAHMLDKKRRRASTFLDLGYGSGILSIVAAKVGYTQIEGIDNDENALTAAEENAKNNNVIERIQFSHADLTTYHTRQQFDFIGANLNTTVLLSYSEKIVSFMHKNSYLCISGIGTENRKAVHNHYKSFGLRCIRKFVGEEWSGYLYKVKPEKLSRLRALRKKLQRKKRK